MPISYLSALSPTSPHAAQTLLFAAESHVSHRGMTSHPISLYTSPQPLLNYVLHACFQFPLGNLTDSVHKIRHSCRIGFSIVSSHLHSWASARPFFPLRHHFAHYISRWALARPCQDMPHFQYALHDLSAGPWLCPANTRHTSNMQCICISALGKS